MINISTPRGKIVTYETKGGKVVARLDWNPSFGAEATSHFNKVQVFIDNEVIKRSDKYIPLRTGVLKMSGILGSRPGEGFVHYIAPYASYQYYKTAKTRNYDPRRGAYWFERMKNAEGRAIIDGARRLARGQK